MAWIRLDDQIAHHPKLTRAGLSSWLWVCCIAFSQKYLTDGFVPEDSVTSLAGGIPDPAIHVERLVQCGLLDRVENGFQIHDYLDFNDSAATVKAKREADRVRKESERNPRGIRTESARNPAGVLARAPASHPIPSLPIKNKKKKTENSPKDGPRFQGRFVVMPFMEKHLQRILGTDCERFDLHAWYWQLEEKLSHNGAVDTSWPWLEKQLLREAKTRGLLLGSFDEIQARAKEPTTPAEKIAAEIEAAERSRSRVRFK